ncbi:hypothetical protein BU16DRAFT_447140, partial [Lophium mytilinum]
FNMPELWWSSWCRRSNGYFGSERGDGRGNFDAYQTWFRFQIKPTWVDKSTGKAHYAWHKFNIFTQWMESTKQTVILLFDPHRDIKVPLLNHLSHKLYSSTVEVPYTMHVYFLEELVRLQNDAVWSIRDLVRNAEKIRAEENGMVTQSDYARLHDVARHAIHVSETLDVAIDTVEAMRKACSQFLFDYRDGVAGIQACSNFEFFQNVLRGLRSRSASNKDRLLNEIQFSFNVIALKDSELARYDSEVSVRIGREAQTDGRAVKTLAFLTLAFLPATFISAVFSMSFFNFNPQNGKWTLSSKFWVYWAVTIPVTLLTILLWSLW